MYGAFEQKNKEVEEHRKFEMSKMRLQTMFLVNLQLPTGKQLKKPEKLMRFEWERGTPEQVPKLTKEDWARREEALSGLSKN